MPVQIISKTEVLEKKIFGTIFYYRRALSQEWNNLVRKNTNRGVTDFDEVGMEILKTHLTGWKDLKDEDEKEVPFNIDTIELIPQEILSELIKAISSHEVNKKEKIVKNS